MKSSKLVMNVALAALLAACSGDKPQSAGGPPAGGGKNAGGPGGGRGAMSFPVEVTTVEARNVEYAITAVGSLAAFEQVAVTARVAGAVERVLFQEGQAVRAGQPLVEIEPERYRLAVTSAQATLTRAEASRSEAQAGLARREAASAKNPGLIRGEEIETWRTRLNTAAAEVAQARAALDQANLNLRDAFVRAPVPGIIQTRTVQTGQYVQVGTVLGTLVRRDPLLVRFDVPEQQSVELKTGMPLRFTASEAGGPFSAKISHVAESANPQSRMVSITAHVDDPRRAALKPGAFAQITVPIRTSGLMPVIPQTAIRPSERGFLAFVVENDTTARERVLEIGLRTADGMVEIRRGLSAGEKLVIRGAEALREGAAVRVEQKQAS